MTYRVALTGFCWEELSGYQKFFAEKIREAVGYETEYRNENPDLEIVTFPGTAITNAKVKILLSGESYNQDDSRYYGYLILSSTDPDRPWPSFIFPKDFFWWPFVGWCNSQSYTPEEIIQERNTRKLVPKTRFCSIVRFHNHGDGDNRDYLTDLLNTYKRVDSAGSYRNNMPDNWKVPGFHYSESLREFYSTGKFVLACENRITPGYITEKLINPLRAGSVPIYWGCPKLKSIKLFNPATYIDISDFSSPELALERIKYLDSPEGADEYQAMLDAPLWLDEPHPVMTGQPFIETIRHITYRQDTYVINMKSRPDRWNNILENNKTFRSIHINLFDAVTHPIGQIGCALSHMSLVQMAKDKQLPYIMVMEDDCLIVDPDNFDRRFLKIHKWLREHLSEWDVFNAGPTYCSADDVLEVLEDDIIRIRKGYCAHMVIYNSSVYDRILQNDPTRPVDVLVSDQFRQVTAVPYLAIQYPSISNVQNGFMDYTKTFSEYESKLLEGIQRL